ncbi:CpsB/CapC family capsule biosynthesis tyrosine phosphatase [Desulfofundulus thermosubterraneus]|uniref:Protein-tyrosine phosphatase n=1 Tax=Desulfofundulus thermosubterraneus DSM 16057 TaxID=1121432 RepID=A0A1M6LAL2_9FIRM|nr:CpsB/CapC family capsule biosynthesis tyrosine phosphatase [Desulfofundulus thermosubterraneus]SHJ68250.1 protein-tyrosine phosphatase [Desulfofundulus thermosubterraneus DSM 16057]
MIDLHAHILPGLDNGAPDLGEALSMAWLAVEDGIESLVATPNVIHREVSFTPTGKFL